ncbi:MAG: UDP-N-acetylglucosamine--N-acetylmuramyl-(pentapeptide) pyrophosphoryl-undecaprenol N-acetylglucosamine transferase [Bryobacterales bacterium]
MWRAASKTLYHSRTSRFTRSPAFSGCSSVSSSAKTASQSAQTRRNKPRTIAVAGGGTAGHVTTGLAVLDEYRALEPETELLFIGSSFGFESRLAPAHGIRLVTLPSSPFMRQGLAGRVRAGFNFLRSAWAARQVLRREKPDLVLGLGGYASAGGVLAARTMGIPVVVHEANVRPGLANKLLGPFVDRVFIAWPQTAEDFPKARTLLTGNPLAREIVAGKPRRPPEPGVRRLLVAGGSEGSPFLNEHAPELAAAIRQRGVDLHVLHQCGWGDVEKIKGEYAKLGVEVRVESFLEEMAEAYAWADFVLCCAGAITLSELAVSGLPAAIVPLGGAAVDHQTPNAVAYAKLTGALHCGQDEWAGRDLAGRSRPCCAT